MTIVKKVLALGLLILITGCAHSIHLVHVSDFSPPGKGKIVAADSEQFVIMGFVRQVDYVDQAYKKLQRACPEGRVVGVTTEYMTNLGFFSWTNRIYMKGRCVTADS